MCQALKLERSEEICRELFCRHVRALKQRHPAASQALLEYSATWPKAPREACEVWELRRLLQERPEQVEAPWPELSPSGEVLRKRWARHCLQSALMIRPLELRIQERLASQLAIPSDLYSSDDGVAQVLRLCCRVYSLCWCRQ